MPTKMPQTKGEKRKADVLRVARVHLIERGYDAFSMREVAAELETKIGHIQYYFPTKHDLFEALVRDEFRANLEAIDAIVARSGPSSSTLEEVARKLVALWVTEGARVYAVMPFLALHNDRFVALNGEVYAQFRVVIGQLLLAALPKLSAAKAHMKARLITALMDGALLQLDGSKAFIDEIVRATLLIAND